MTRDEEQRARDYLRTAKMIATLCAADVRKRHPIAALRAAEALVSNARQAAKVLRAVVRRERRSPGNRTVGE